MAFKVRKLKFRRWPVSLAQRECQDDGSVADVDARFIGQFKPFSEAEVMAIRTEVFGAGTDEEMAKDAEARTVAEQGGLEGDFYSRLMSGWEGVTDEADQPIVFSTKTLKDLCTGPDGTMVRRGLATAILEIRFGIAPAKNVATSPAAGPAPAAVEVATSTQTT
jgi:hypothetical protein